MEQAGREEGDRRGGGGEGAKRDAEFGDPVRDPQGLTAREADQAVQTGAGEVQPEVESTEGDQGRGLKSSRA